MLPESLYSKALRGISKRTYAKNERTLMMKLGYGPMRFSQRLGNKPRVTNILRRKKSYFAKVPRKTIKHMARPMTFGRLRDRIINFKG